MYDTTKPTKAKFMRILNEQGKRDELKGYLLYCRDKKEFDRQYFIWLKKYINDRSLKKGKF